MIQPGPDEDFRRFCSAGDTAALGRVFERLAPELLLVAAHLAGSGAEDLVQATFLDAIRQRERWEKTRPLAPWLVGILANHVMRARREQRRTPDPRRLPLKEEEGPQAAAEARELAEAVHAAVEGLPLAYRQVLSLRLVHGLELQQIGSALGMPLGTVKTKLHRGMVLLRRALPAGLTGVLAMALLPGRGLAAMREVVLSHAGAATVATVGAGALLGVLTMKKAITFAAGAAVLALGAWGVASAWPRADAGSPDPKQPMELRAPADAATAAVEPAPAAAAIKETPAAPLQREPLPTTGTLEVDVVWSDGTGAVGLEVRSYLRRKDSPMKSQPALTDAAGRASFADLAPGEYGVICGRNPAKSARATIEAGAVARCKLSLENELLLDVQVVDAGDRPQAGAEVWGTDPEQHRDPARLLGRSDGSGRLTHRCLSLYQVWARKAGSQPSLPTAQSLFRDEQGQAKAGRVQVRLVLGDSACSLQGLVVDPEGRPVPGALVVIAQDESVPKLPSAQDQRAVALKTVASAQGRFACDEIGEGEHPVQAVADGFGAMATRVRLTREQPTTVTLQLRVGATVTGRVTQRDGTPISGAQVTGSPSRYTFGFEQFHQALGVRETLTDGEGRYRLGALRAGEISLTAQTGGHESQRRMELKDGETASWDVTLPEGSDVSGRVVDGEGKGLRGWLVTAMGVPDRASGRSADRRTSTDAEGKFVLQGLTGGKVSVAAFDGRAKGAAGMVWHALAEDVQPPVSDLVLRVAVGEGAWIEGRIVWPEGAVHQKVELSLYPAQRGRSGFYVPQEYLPANRDEFRIGPLPAGQYDLLCDAEGQARLSLRKLQLVAGQTLPATFRLDLQQSLRLRLRHEDGRPAAGAVVRLENGEVSWVVCKETGPGEYQSPPTTPGSYTAKVRGPDFAMFTTTVEVGAAPDAWIERTVPAGTAVHFRFKPAGTAPDRWVGALNVTLKDAQGAELVKEMVPIDGSAWFDWRLGLAPGSYHLAAVEFTDRGRKVMTVQVDAAGSKPQIIEVQLEKH